MNPSLSTAFGYIRVSTHMQEELSPDAQKREIQRWADAHKIQILRWFQDTGISGKKASNRSDFQQMISLAKEAAHPDYILTWKFSRFARNQEESIVYKSLLRKNNVQVISVSEPLPDGPFSSLIERIIEWMDEYYSIRLSGEVRRGMMEKALSGGYQSPPPLGYQKPPGTSIPQVYEPEAAIYRQIKEYALAGRSPTSIARLLNSQGLRTKRGHAFDSRSIRLSPPPACPVIPPRPLLSYPMAATRHFAPLQSGRCSAPSSRQKTTTGDAVPLPAPTTSAAACFAALTVVLP